MLLVLLVTATPISAAAHSERSPKGQLGKGLLLGIFLNGQSPASLSFIFGIFQANTMFAVN